MNFDKDYILFVVNANARKNVFVCGKKFLTAFLRSKMFLHIYSHIVSRVLKPKKIKWAWHMARMREKRKAYNGVKGFGGET